MQGRAEKEFAAPDFPATRFMACRNLPIQPSKHPESRAPTLQQHLDLVSSPTKTNQVTPGSTNPARGCARRGNISSEGKNTPRAGGTALRKVEEAKSSMEMVAWSSPLAVLATCGAHRVRMLFFSCSALGQSPPGIPLNSANSAHPPLCPLT